MANPIEALAAKFTILLAEEIGDQNLREVARKNVDLDGACASHDYCDTNMVMLDAFTHVMGRHPAFLDNPDEQVDTLLWNQAWRLAKQGWPT